MHPDWTIIGVFIAILTLIVTYLQLNRTPKKPRAEPVQKPAHNTLYKTILKNKKITLGYFHYPPFIMLTDDEARPQGFFPALMEEVAKANDLTIVWKLIVFSDAVGMLERNEVDVIVSIFQTPKRTQRVDFTAFLHSIAVGGVAKKSINYLHSQADLVSNNLKVVVCREEIGHEFAEWVKISKNKLTIIETDDNAKIVSYVEMGQADVALLDSVSIINYFETMSKNRNSLKPVFRRRPLTICLNGIMLPQREPDLAEWLDIECKKARKKPEVKQLDDEILEKYHGVVNRL